MKKVPKYSPEFRERALRLVFEHQEEHNTQWAAIVSIASGSGVGGGEDRRLRVLDSDIAWLVAPGDQDFHCYVDRVPGPAPNRPQGGSGRTRRTRSRRAGYRRASSGSYSQWRFRVASSALH
jgi:hypothetical protein